MRRDSIISWRYPASSWKIKHQVPPGGLDESNGFCDRMFRATFFCVAVTSREKTMTQLADFCDRKLLCVVVAKMRER